MNFRRQFTPFEKHNPETDFACRSQTPSAGAFPACPEDLLCQRRDKLDLVAEELMKRETLDGAARQLLGIAETANAKLWNPLTRNRCSSGLRF